MHNRDRHTTHRENVTYNEYTHLTERERGREGEGEREGEREKERERGREEGERSYN